MVESTNIINMKPCVTEEERGQRKRANWSKYSNKPWSCDVCNIQIRLGNKSKHLKTKKHQTNR